MINKIFNALGNGRPQILVKLEDFVLESIISISEGKPREEAVQILHSQISSSMKDLREDDDAMLWFKFPKAPRPVHSTPLPFEEFPSTPLARASIFNFI